MPIYAPTLPPRPEPGQGQHPALVMFRFDLRRVLRLKLGRFFGFLFLFALIVVCAKLYFQHLVSSNAGLSQLRPLAESFMPQGPRFQADLLNDFVLTVLWLQVALVGGGLVARDTLYRIRPLVYAHPVRPRDYLLGKVAFAAGLPFAILLAYILVPWGLSLAIAGLHGPVWPTVPLRLVPAALVVSALMGAVTLGASSLAGSPKAGFGWALGIIIGSNALAGVLTGGLGDGRWRAVSVSALSQAWPNLMVGSERGPGWGPVLLATALHLGLWTLVAVRRTRPGEATL